MQETHFMKLIPMDMRLFDILHVQCAVVTAVPVRYLLGVQAGICAVGISSVLSGQGSASAETTQSQILLGMAPFGRVPVACCYCVLLLPVVRLSSSQWSVIAELPCHAVPCCALPVTCCAVRCCAELPCDV